MKNSKLLLLLGVASIVIVGFLLFSQMDGKTQLGSRVVSQAPTPTQTQIQTVIFKGTSPCADCPGIDVVLTLKYDGATNVEGSYTQRLTYQEKNVAPFTESGTWKGLPNDIIELTPSGENSQKQYYLQTQANTLEALGADQQKLPSPYNYTLVAGE